MKCPNCGNEAQADAIFCDQCGTRLKPQAEVPTQPQAQPVAAPVAAAPSAAPQGSICPKCGASNTPGEMFCSECGEALAAPQPEPAAVAAAAAVVAGTSVAPAEPGASPRCRDCGATVAAGDEFCYACGADLRAQAAAPAPVPQAAPQPAPAPQPVVEAAPVVPPSPAPAAAPARRECPSCGAQVGLDDAFCQACGAALTGPAQAQAAPAAAQPIAPSVAPQPAPALQAASAAVGGPRLIVVASGIEIPLPAGKEVLVGREDPYSGVFPDVDLTPHGAEEGGVSRRHFKITFSGGQYLVEDLNSTNGTVLNRQRLQAGHPLALADGDEIRAGHIRLVFKVS